MATYQEYYRRIANVLDDVRLDRDEEIAIFGAIIQRFLNREFGPVLDIGCGTGRYASHLQHLGYSVVGIDNARSQLFGRQERLLAVYGTAFALPFDRLSFSCCLMCLVLQQLNPANRIDAIREAGRVTRRGGFLTVKTCSHDDLRKRPFQELFPSALGINLRRYPDIPELVQQIDSAEAGFGNPIIIPTFSELTTTIEQFLFSVQTQCNTTLALLPKGEFQAGRNALRRSLANAETVRIPHYHTILVVPKTR